MPCGAGRGDPGASCELPALPSPPEELRPRPPLPGAAAPRLLCFPTGAEPELPEGGGPVREAGVSVLSVASRSSVAGARSHRS